MRIQVFLYRKACVINLGKQTKAQIFRDRLRTRLRNQQSSDNRKSMNGALPSSIGREVAIKMVRLLVRELFDFRRQAKVT